MHTALISLEKKHEHPILIIDKKGILGESLAHQLKNEFIVVLVSKSIVNQHENILHIPFVKKFPTIPDNRYSHILLIDENLEVAKDIMKPFIKKAKKDNAFFIFSFNKELASEEFIRTTLDLYENTKVILIGDVFSQNEIYNPKTQVNKFIYQAKTLGKIEVPGNGMGETQAIFFDDVVSGILEAAFLEDKYKLYYLFPKHKITLLMLAHMLQKKDPDIKVSFINETKVKPKNEYVIKNEGKYLISEDYNTFDKIKKINLSNLTIINGVNNKFNKEKSNREINFPFVLLFFISFLLLPLVISLFFTLAGFNSLYLVKNAFDKNNFAIAKPLAVFSFESFTIAKKSTEILEEEVSLIGQRKKVEEFKRKIDLGINASSGVVSVISAAEKYKKVVSGLSKNPPVEFFEAQTELKNALYLYSKEKDSEIIPKLIKTKLTDVINLSLATIDFWPDILGFNGQKTYLVLFQNNMELRPGGGFIGSYAILTLDKGKIASFKIYDVYDADGQLKTHVEPPFPIRRFLPLVNWYLRDSNFNLDFSKGAIASAIFLNSETHQVVDGVIGVDLFFVKNLLSVTGPIYISEYKETVDKDNFYQITQAYAEKDFFPGSTQKKDFLRSFYNSLFTKLIVDQNLAYLKLLNVLTDSIYEKHILFAFNDPNTQAAFAINGLSSSLFDERKKEKGAINDFMGINEANLGANKVNYYITRNLSQEVLIADDGTISENLTISFNNSSQDKIYKNYLRIELPIRVKISKITLDGKEQKLVDAVDDPAVYEKKNFKPPVGLEIKKDNQAQNSIFGFLININPRESKVIKISYEFLDKLVLTKPEFSYSLKLFKQPGIDFYPYDLILNYPQGFNVVKNTKEIKIGSDKLIFSSQIRRDMDLKINFAAK